MHLAGGLSARSWSSELEDKPIPPCRDLSGVTRRDNLTYLLHNFLLTARACIFAAKPDGPISMLVTVMQKCLSCYSSGCCKNHRRKVCILHWITPSTRFKGPQFHVLA